MLYCNRCIKLSTQIIHEKQTQKIKKAFKILQCSTLNSSTAVGYNSWHLGADVEWTGEKSCWLEEGEGVGGGRRVISSRRWRASFSGAHVWRSWTSLRSGPVPPKHNSASSDRANLHDWTCERMFATLKAHTFKLWRAGHLLCSSGQVPSLL